MTWYAPPGTVDENKSMPQPVRGTFQILGDKKRLYKLPEREKKKKKNQVTSSLSGITMASHFSTARGEIEDKGAMC